MSQVVLGEAHGGGGVLLACLGLGDLRLEDGELLFGGGLLRLRQGHRGVGLACVGYRLVVGLAGGPAAGDQGRRTAGVGGGAGLLGLGACQPISANMLRELGAVAAALGVDIAKDIEAKIAGPRSASKHKTSLLQDFERGRPMEIDPIAGAVAEMGRLTGTKTPWIDAMYALIRLLAETTGCYAPNPAFRLAVA